MRAYIPIILWILGVASGVQAGVYWNAGIQPSSVSLCFVGDALTSRPDRVQQILDYIEEFEWAANIRFDYWGTCPSSVAQPDGTDFFDGNIRVVIPGVSVNGTGPVPGNGCPMFLDENGTYNGANDGWGSWSNPPSDLPIHRSCQYNLKLGDDPWDPVRPPYLNHTLHEFGHALGLAHEHERADVNAGCTENGYGGGATSYLTPYDTESVMHYKFDSCGIAGNYGDTGLSSYDRLSFHILYPETERVAEFVGTTVLRTPETLHLQAGWKSAGANINFVAKQFHWKLNGVTYSTTPDLVTALSAGKYQFEFSHWDFLNRSYLFRSTIQVLTPDQFNRTIAGPLAARLPLY